MTVRPFVRGQTKGYEAVDDEGEIICAVNNEFLDYLNTRTLTDGTVMQILQLSFRTDQGLDSLCVARKQDKCAA